jgi:hypothetical protein
VTPLMAEIMLKYRFFVFQQAGVVGFGLLAATVALAASKDKPATELANDAMQSDYVGTHFKKAEQKLKKAIAQCGASACSYDVVGRLHRDLATVYMAGMNQGAKGKAELQRALQANPDLELDADLSTPELRKAFKALGGHEPKPAEEAEKEAPKREKAEADCERGSEGCAKPTKEQESAPGKFPKNWISVHFEQDLLLYSGHDNVCARANVAGTVEAPGYACYQGGSQFGYAAGQEIQAGSGNHVAGGVGRATERVLLGFDRLLGSNVSLGLRLGFAFFGGPTRRPNVKFLPIHAELRANYWFGSHPFESSTVRPYVSLSAGLAEVDGHVLVEYYDTQGKKGSLDAWRKTGNGFAGLGFGMMIPIGNSGIVPEVRALELFGNSGTGFDVALGYAYGF